MVFISYILTYHVLIEMISLNLLLKIPVLRSSKGSSQICHWSRLWTFLASILVKYKRSLPFKNCIILCRLFFKLIKTYIFCILLLGIISLINLIDGSQNVKLIISSKPVSLVHEKIFKVRIFYF